MIVSDMNQLVSCLYFTVFLVACFLIVLLTAVSLFTTCLLCWFVLCEPNISASSSIAFELLPPKSCMALDCDYVLLF